MVTWRRAQMVLLSAQNMPVAKIAEVTFTSDDRVRNVLHKFNADGFDSLYPKYRGGHPKTFTLPERRATKKFAKSKPTEHGLPFSTWSLAKLADFLVAGGWSTAAENAAGHRFGCCGWRRSSWGDRAGRSGPLHQGVGPGRRRLSPPGARRRSAGCPSLCHVRAGGLPDSRRDRRPARRWL